MSNSTVPWRVSLHGGHSRGYCDHAHDPLRAILDAAVDAGYHTYGVTEHAPRPHEKYLYDTEREWGWTPEKLQRDFDTYCVDIAQLAEEYAHRITILRGFEIEAVPADNWIGTTTALRNRETIDYVVGSIHFLHETTIDGPPELFEQAMSAAGGLEALCIQYYSTVADMIRRLQPEVAGHLDVINKNGHRFGATDTPAIRAAAEEAVRAAVEKDVILDLNTAGYRKGLPTPYPAPWLLEMARDAGACFCFGDDAHSVGDVGAGVNDARKYLMDHGIDSVTYLTRKNGAIVREQAAL